MKTVIMHFFLVLNATSLACIGHGMYRISTLVHIIIYLSMQKCADAYSCVWKRDYIYFHGLMHAASETGNIRTQNQLIL